MILLQIFIMLTALCASISILIFGFGLEVKNWPILIACILVQLLVSIINGVIKGTK